MATASRRSLFRRAAVGLIGVFGLLASVPSAHADAAPLPVAKVYVAAAASVLAPLGEAIGAYRSNQIRRGPRRSDILPIYGSSGSLARQIVAGGPAQIFISANRRWMDEVAKSGRLRPDTRRAFVANELVLAARRDSTLDIALKPGTDLAAALGGGRLATADPAHAPLGQYAKIALGNLGLWDGIAAKLVLAPDAARARVLVERGAAAAGILYASDIGGAGRLKILARFPAGSYPLPVYEIAVIGLPPPGDDTDAAGDFVAFLTSPAGQGIFARHGFRTATGADH